MMLPHIDVTLADGVEADERKLGKQVHQAVEATLRQVDLDFPEGAELSVLIGDDDMLRSLNREWRGKDTPTNVLSFPGSDIAVGERAGKMLGDIAISLETAHREAGLETDKFDSHLSHLIVHGFLHLFGYDHEIDEEADLMEGLERKVLAELGIAIPILLGDSVPWQKLNDDRTH